MYLLNQYSDGTISLIDALGVSLKGIIVVMLILAVLAVIVMLLSKAIRLFQGKQTQPETPKPVITAPKPAAKTDGSPSQGELKLINTDEKTAAVIMAIVSDESKIPLERLKFNSIKLIDNEEDAK